jgi:HPt (histidine-containing phosphotransfer) domain-containing protein
LTGEQRENLGMVKTSADALLQVITDILDFSKIEAGKLELDPSPFALRDSLGATLKALSVRAHEKGLEFNCRVGPEVPDGLVGDSLRLRQIVTNLVGNAVKFTARGEVAMRVDVEGESAETVCLHFSVRDTGIGIPADKQRVIFEAFTQADGSSTRRFGGTGLGLAISAQLVALMGGRLWVDSAPGQGSTFHFTVGLGLETVVRAPHLSLERGGVRKPTAGEPDEALPKWVQDRTVPANGRAASVFDQAASLERTGGDEQLLGEMAVLFAAECPKRMQEIREAIARQDAACLERAAHTFQGSVSNFCAPAAVAAVGKLETMGRAGVLDGASVAYEALESALQQLKPALARLTEDRPAAPCL